MERFFYFAVLFLLLLTTSCSDTGQETVEISGDKTDYLKSADSLYELSAPYRDSGHDSLKIIARQLVSLGEAHKDVVVVVRGTLLEANYEWMRVNYTAAIKMAVDAVEKAKKKGLKKNQKCTRLNSSH